MSDDLQRQLDEMHLELDALRARIQELEMHGERDAELIQHQRNEMDRLRAERWDLRTKLEHVSSELTEKMRQGGTT